MLLLAITALLAAQDPASPPPGNLVSPLVIEGKKAAEVPSRLEITEGLNGLLKKEPDRVVCLDRKPLGSRIPRIQCDTLRNWYLLQAKTGERDGGALEDTPPTELVAAVQEQYLRKAMQIREQKAAAAAAGKR
ncbi:hypothetical protein [Caulobacter sp.]|uniref:hypothetical protein n=1 Tax=Caulobacter sp. TaxID=78 RepID=UPI001B0F69CE|nr:hypothetical protein [Caulobacter sp.]MBO9543038.1 hypothetical protein [Caulobacter sp.]